MQSHRKARLQSAIQRELSCEVPRQVKDPRIPAVTFTAVEINNDGSVATIYVTLLGGILEGGDQKSSLKMKKCLEGLASASGLLRRHLAKALSVRFIPQLIFKEDKGLENANRVFELLKKMNETKPVQEENLEKAATESTKRESV